MVTAEEKVPKEEKRVKARKGKLRTKRPPPTSRAAFMAAAG